MDPSGYGQTPPPPPPAPPDWSQPGQPVAPGQPAPYGQAPYGQPPYGQPAGMWAAPVAPKKRSRLVGVVIAVVVVVVLGIAGLVYVGLTSGVGQVTFSMTADNSGNKSCKFASPVTQITTSDKVYLMAYFHDTLQPGDSVTVTVTKDGVAFGDNTVTVDKTMNCDVEPDAVGPLQAGVYKLTYTHNGTVEAEGTLTVK